MEPPETHPEQIWNPPDNHLETTWKQHWNPPGTHQEHTQNHILAIWILVVVSSL